MYLLEVVVDYSIEKLMIRPGIRFIISFVLITLLFSAKMSAQVTLTCESGNLGVEVGNCWSFESIHYTNTSGLVIAGSYSARSNPVTTNNPQLRHIKTPWMLVGNGNITFKARLDANSNQVTAFAIKLYYIPFNAGASNKEGTPSEFFTYNFPAFNVTTIRDIVVPIPAEIQNSVQPYRFRVSFIATGGNERVISDSYSFPGTYFANPACGCIPQTPVQDADSDGVPDNQDQFPNDPYRAFVSYFPSSSSYGTLAFEDSWPNRADYDLNDLVTDYKISTVTNGANQVVEVIGKFVARASGASYKNALCLQLDGISPGKVSSVEGNVIAGDSVFFMQSNGVESGQSFANCVIFDNFYKVMQHPGNGSGINTDKMATYVPYDTLTVILHFIVNGTVPPAGSVNLNDLSSTKFNFYTVVNQHRGHEVHLADFRPSSLANSALFGTGIDDTQPSAGKYYKSADNLPWGINVIQGFNYPSEKSSIDIAYLHFVEWAQSSGQSYPNWFQNLPGYRNSANIY